LKKNPTYILQMVVNNGDEIHVGIRKKSSKHYSKTKICPKISIPTPLNEHLNEGKKTV